MNRTSRIAAVAVVGLGLVASTASAQYTADYQTNIISGVTSNWAGDYVVGSNFFANVLLIESGGVLSNRYGYLGYEARSSNNYVLVTDPGSVWSNNGILLVGRLGSGNSLVISNGGWVTTRFSSPFVLSDCIGWLSNSSNNSVVVTGTGSVWDSLLGVLIGGAGNGNSLLIRDGGQVVSGSGSIGQNTNGNNIVIVSDAGSVWSSGGILSIAGAGNRLVISNGGQVVSGRGQIYGISNNIALVIGTGSAWRIAGLLRVGVDGSRNSLVISNGGQVTISKDFLGDDAISIGEGDGDHNNSIEVIGAGSVLSNNGTLYVGVSGTSNKLVVAGGSVFATNLVIGFASIGCDNLVQLDSGNVTVTNAATDATFEVRRGKLVLNGGTLQVDRFVMTNTCAQFVHTGGTLIYGTALLDPNRDDDGDGIPNGWEQSYGLDPLNAADGDADNDGDGQNNLAEFLAGTVPTNSASVLRIVEVVPENDDMRIGWSAVGGKRYAVQTTTGDSGGYTNNFVDLNPAVVAPGTGETAVVVFHLGGATNVPALFYRIRLVP